MNFAPMYGTSFVSVVAVPHASGLASRREWAAFEVQDHVAEGLFGVIAEGRGHPPGRFVGHDRAFEAHRDAVARGLGVEVHGVRLTRDRTGFGPAEVDVALQRSRREVGDVQGDRADFRAGRAFDRVPCADADLLGLHASRPCAADGVERHPFRQRDGRVFQLRGVDFFGPAACGDVSSAVTPSG